MADSINSVSRTLTAAIAAISGLFGTAAGGGITYLNEHAKLVEAKIADQKTTEINAFLKASQDLYPLVSDEVGKLKLSAASGSIESKALIKNLELQYSSLQSAASYLPADKRDVASSYQADLVKLLHEAKTINGPTQAKPFVDALHDAVIHRCEVTAGLRKSAGLPPALDPACDVNSADASSGLRVSFFIDNRKRGA